MSFSLVADSNKGKSVLSSSMEQEKKKKTDDETILQKVSQKVSYKDILSDTDFEYIISGTSLKENINMWKKVRLGESNEKNIITDVDDVNFNDYYMEVINDKNYTYFTYNGKQFYEK